MDNFFQDTYKVNMGNKKDLTKDQILEQSRKERINREIARKQYEAAARIQKQLRLYTSNKNMVNQIFGDQ